MLSFDDIAEIGIVGEVNFERLKRKKINGVSTDSRKVKNGEIFFAIKGERFDGHDFVGQAFSKGAVACVVEKNWFFDNSEMFRGKILIAVEDTVKALGKLANIYRKKFEIPVIAIGGSNGKTTTKEMIAKVLEQKYDVLKTEGNLNNHIGVPMTLFRLRRRHEIAVIELGMNHFGELKYLCEVAEPSYGLITNIGREHIEFLGDLEGVARAEGEIFDYLFERDGFIFVNIDDKYLSKMGEKFEKKLTFGFSSDADVKGEILEFDALARAKFKVKFDGREAVLKLKIPGEHVVSNALGAFAVGLKFGVPVSKIKKALSTYVPFSKRMEVMKVNGITIVNDTYNANPDSVIASLKVLKLMKAKGKRIAVLGDMLELGSSSEELHREIGKKVIEMGIDYLLTFGKEMLNAHEVALGGIHNAMHFDNKELLAYHLFELVQKGDVVLVKGSRGMRMEEVVEKLVKKLRKS